MATFMVAVVLVLLLGALLAAAVHVALQAAEVGRALRVEQLE